MKLSVNIDALEKQRFARHILHNQCDFYYHQDKRSILGKCKFNNAKQVFIWGRRPPDIEAFKLASNTADTIIILQHAKNPRREQVPLSYYKQNFKKVIYWLSSIGRLKLSRWYSIKKTRQPKVLLFYFTEAYKKEWQQHFTENHNVEYIMCNSPDVSRFGAKTDTKVCSTPVSCFYVDEPLTQTLGISEQQEITLLIELQQLIGDTIYVKLHPRSNTDKFKHLNLFKVVDCIYQNASSVAGYRSGLLDYQFNNDTSLTLQKDLSWQKQLKKRASLTKQDYATQVKEYLLKHDL
ncbi:polysialyltransferase family glycosyltransferase [Pseudoalteromonas sp.]|uniref:polysialyltransferase family glycosyltransferase n=1 Tax=Pseudoalteromonas sp. TaxID=53249 RepID=UPI00356620F9